MNTFIPSLPFKITLNTQFFSSTNNKPRQSIPTTRAFRCTISDSSKDSSTSAVLDSIIDRLREELPILFLPEQQGDYSLYASDVIFEDPLNKFRGVKRYASNIKFLNSSPVFSDAQLDLYDIKKLPNRNTIRTRWALRMTANLPWNPCIAFTGQSDYVVDPQSQKVIKHIDYWDSLSESSFFSFPAVKDLVTQCTPESVGPTDFGGFTLLRRTPTLQIRRFSISPITLHKQKNSSIDTWVVSNKSDSTQDDAVNVTDIAVYSLKSQNPTSTDIRDAEQTIRAELKNNSYASAGERTFYVKTKIRGKDIHEVWVELEEANALVDT